MYSLSGQCAGPSTVRKRYPSCYLLGAWSYNADGSMRRVSSIVEAYSRCELVTGAIPDDAYIHRLLRMAAPRGPGLYFCSSVTMSGDVCIPRPGKPVSMYLKACKRSSRYFYASVSCDYDNLMVPHLATWPDQFMMGCVPDCDHWVGRLTELIRRFLRDDHEYLIPIEGLAEPDAVEILQVDQGGDLLRVNVPDVQAQYLYAWMFEKSSIEHVRAYISDDEISDWISGGCDVGRLRFNP